MWTTRELLMGCEKVRKSVSSQEPEMQNRRPWCAMLKESGMSRIARHLQKTCVRSHDADIFFWENTKLVPFQAYSSHPTDCTEGSWIPPGRASGSHQITRKTFRRHRKSSMKEVGTKLATEKEIHTSQKSISKNITKILRSEPHSHDIDGASQ